jgi:hypothetical protein
VARCQGHKFVGALLEEWIAGHQQGGNAVLCNGFKSRINLAISTGS